MINRRIFVPLLFAFLMASSALCQDTCSNEQFYAVASKHGYPIQTHTTVTTDGFHLTMFRLQKGRFREGLPVAFIQHGFLQSSEGWVINDAQNSLLVKLVEKGYDVWLGNNRGTKYSMQNDFHAQDQKQYWEFSFQQMGLLDQPAMIGYVLKHTGQPDLVYFGHSQGTSQMFAALSDEKTSEFMNKAVRHYVALAPIVFMTHCEQQFIDSISPYRTEVIGAFDLLKRWFVEKNNCSPKLSNIEVYNLMCRDGRNLEMCLKPYKFTDRYPEVNNLPLTGYFVNSKPQAFSVQILNHYSQIINLHAPKFQKFDWGVARNMIEYGQPTPPQFDLSRITTRVTALVGTGDFMSTPADVADLSKAIPQMKVQVMDKWGHTTFMLGKVSGPVYDSLLQDL